MSASVPSIVLETLADADLRRVWLPIFTIYRMPSDFPGVYVVRVWDGKDCTPTPFASLHDTLEAARADVPAGMYRIARTPDDDAVIVESYV